MSNNTEFDGIAFDLPKHQSNVIKVIGVGGGGSNAINHMFQSGINGVDFVILNTDSQALQNSAVPNKIQLGVSLTEGLGAGANPEVGEQAALESMEDIKAMLDTTTKMVFITAGMGGGTGTGAAPVIAKQAKEMDILTVGIVTMPFQFEGKMRCQQAQLGIEKLRSNVDSLIVINNNKLREVYGNLGFKAGFSKADEVLSTAARGIAEVITHHYTQNIDLRDAKTVLSNSGTAIMGSAVATGSARANEAIMKALDSPLLNDNKITGAKNVLLLIVSGSQEITIDEIGEINDHIQIEAGHGANIIMGVGEDEDLGEAISVTVIATGFNIDQQDDIVNSESKKIIHTLEDEQRAVQNLSDDQPVVHQLVEDEVVEEPTIKYVLEDDIDEIGMDLIPTTNYIRNFNVFYEEVIEEVAKTDVRDDDFIIIDTNDVINDIEVIDPQEVVASKEDDQFAISFDMPLSKTSEDEEQNEENVITFSLDDEVNDINVKDHVEVIPVLEYNKNGETRYSLDDYMELENKLTGAKSKAEEFEPKIVEDELVFEKKTIPTEVTEENTAEEIDPMDSPIEALLKERADERRKKLKDFNYKFQNNINSIEEIEKEPAYKRQGIDLSEQPKENKVSRTTLSEDSNDDIQLRSNNSFLHDNVD
ncbi:cell division protein FtsZ [Flavobacteriaceae bacterium TP-CH-4]|uniref:Cell division protein FtsZ n=1 Tax=Pelagihabitans pacificus TaxID=2696054 RepID=A0A967AXD4_9FLAO|nr:cell division protein FtsZ [Pelagihabitans pacificus]NHF60880.1 cell division protein FtsZ [Pelagihabitans pacificus]